jgi:hypothetical protein
MPILGITASSILKVSDTGAMFPLQVVTVGSSGASSVTFSNIPNTYSHLQIRLIARTSYVGENSTGLKIQFNSDTGSNYSWHRVYGDGGSAFAGAGTNQTVMRIDRMPATSVNSSIFGTAVVDILDYANTNKYKTIRSLGGWDSNGAGWAAFNSGSWRNTNAVTSIQIADADSTTIPQYSSFALYGIKAA